MPGRMTTTRAFRCEDMISFNNIISDAWTETFSVPSHSYGHLIPFLDYSKDKEHPKRRLKGYVMRKLKVMAFFGTVTRRR